MLVLGKDHLHRQLLVASPLSQSALPPGPRPHRQVRGRSWQPLETQTEKRGPHTGVVVSLVLRCSGSGGGGRGGVVWEVWEVWERLCGRRGDRTRQDRTGEEGRVGKGRRGMEWLAGRRSRWFAGLLAG